MIVKTDPDNLPTHIVTMANPENLEETKRLIAFVNNTTYPISVGVVHRRQMQLVEKDEFVRLWNVANNYWFYSLDDATAFAEVWKSWSPEVMEWMPPDRDPCL